MAGKSGNGSEDNAFRVVSEALAQQLPSLYRVLVVNRGDFDRLTVYQRSQDDILAVLKRVSADGSPEVCFGNGFDFVAALVGLEGSLKAGKWRADKPAPGRSR